MGKTQEVLRDYEKNTPLNLEAAQVTLSSNRGLSKAFSAQITNDSNLHLQKTSC